VLILNSYSIIEFKKQAAFITKKIGVAEISNSDEFNNLKTFPEPPG
jgi:hypothetical protein